MKEIKYTVLYCFNFCDSILLQFRNRKLLRGPVPLRFVIKLQFRFYYCNSYGSYGSGSVTLVLCPEIISGDGSVLLKLKVCRGSDLAEFVDEI
jgi:hypothetical protein